MVPIEQLESPEANQIWPRPQPQSQRQSPHERMMELEEMSDDCDPAAPPSPAMDQSLLPETQALVAKLRRAQVFQPFPSVWGYGEGLQLTLQLSHQPDAIAAFDWLANQPRPVPQLYAYMELRALSREHARAHIPDLAHDLRKVTVDYGCSSLDEEVRDLERKIASSHEPAPSSPEYQPPPPPPPPRPPKTVSPALLDALRISGKRNIYPDDVTKTEIKRAGQDKVIGSFKVCITAEGNIKDLWRLKSTGFPAYDNKILAAMHEWRYRPYKVDGEPVQACTVVSFIYKTDR
jgi:hypothetical protein